MKKFVIILVVVVALGAGALVSFGGMSWLDSMGLRGQDRLVESRVRGYWQARVDRDLEEQVEFLHPQQGSVADSGMLVTESFEITGIEIDGDDAVADLVVKSRLKHPILSARDRTVEMQTKWVKHEGKWYRALAPQTVFEIIQNEHGNWTPPTAAQQNVPLESEPATSTQ
jgi:hypothetical protein